MCYDKLKKARNAEMRNYFKPTGRPENPYLDEYVKLFEDAAVAKKSKEIAKSLIESGVSIETISKSTSIPIEELKKIFKNKKEDREVLFIFLN